MCGLFGFAGRIKASRRRALLQSLALWNSSRGEDSTGLACINRAEQSPLIYKETVAPAVAVNDEEFLRTCKSPGNVWIGHTRWATHGGVTRENAHPYHLGDTIGAHNGVVSITQSLIDRCDGKDFKVDSQYLIYLLNRDGEVGEIDGSAALAFTHLKGACDLSLIRWHNPLHVAWLPKDAGIAWSSEYDALQNSLALVGITEWELVQFDDATRLNVFLKADGSLDDVQSDDCGITSAPKQVYPTYRYKDSRKPVDFPTYDMVRDKDGNWQETVTRMSPEDRQALVEYYSQASGEDIGPYLDDETAALIGGLEGLDEDEIRELF